MKIKKTGNKNKSTKRDTIKCWN